MKFNKPIIYIFLLVLFLSISGGLALAKNDKYKMKYRGMDRNHDGVVTRVEWRGNNQSFQNQDWNGDGVLSGNEVRAGAQRNDDNNYFYNDNGNNSFANLDFNRDNNISRSEWRGDRSVFDRLDCNYNASLTRDEYQSRTECNATASNATFRSLDNNNDGYLYMNEWNSNTQVFVNKDCNRDNRVSRSEYYTQNCSSTVCDNDCLFREIDINNDGLIYRTEWRGNAQTFNQLDHNNNDSLTRTEMSYLNQKRQGTTQQAIGTFSDVINQIFGQ